jgi:hypothetical protein
MADQQDERDDQERQDQKDQKDQKDQSDALLPFEGNGRLIRRQWHDGRWFLSVADVSEATQ